MATNKQAIRVYVNEKQSEAAEALAEIYGEKSVSELVRKLIADACAKHGIAWEEDPVTWGGKRQRKVPKDEE